MDCCTKHAPDGMDDVKNRKCRTRGYCNQPFFRVTWTGMVEYNLFSERVAQQGCGIRLL